MPYSLKRWFSLFIKLFLLAAMLYSLYHQLFIKRDITSLWMEFHRRIDFERIHLLLIVLALLLVNWCLETLKWHILVNKYYSISFSDSVKAILMGLSFGVVTPNRSGEFAGRLIMVPKEYNLLSVKSNLMTSLSQNLSTLACGLLATFFFAKPFDFIGVNNTQLLVFLVPLLVACLWIYFYIEPILRFPIVRKLNQRFPQWGLLSEFSFPWNDKLKVLSLALLRFLIYSIQFALILQFLGADVDLVILLGLVIIIFFIQSFIPLPPLINLLARGEIALILFSEYNVNELVIICGIVFIWIINVVIPALIGLMLILKSRIYESV